MTTPDEFDLGQLEDAWDTAEPPAGNGEFPPLPDGLYDVKVERCSLKFSRESKRPMVSVGMVVTSGNYSKRWLWKNLVFTANPQQMGFVKRDLSFLGIRPAKLAEINDHLGAAIGREFTVKKQQDGQWERVYFQYESILPEDASQDIEDDDLPL